MKNELIYRTIFDNSEEGIWLVDGSGKTLMVNKKLAQILGHHPEEFVGKLIFEFMDEKWKNEAQNQIERRKIGVSEHHEMLLRKKDGTKVWVRLASSPILDDTGSFVGALALVTDITKSKREQILLHVQKNIFELLAKGGALNEALCILVNGIENLIDEVIGSVLLLNADGTRVVTGAAPNLPKEFSDAINLAPIGPNAGSCGTAIFKKETVAVEDIEHNDLWGDYKDLALAHGLKASWLSPILSHSGKVLGSFAMYFKEVRKVTEEEISWVEEFVSAARLAIEHMEIREQDKKMKLHSAILAEARETLVETLHYRKVLLKIPALLTKEFADGSMISLENESGVLEIVATSSRNSKISEILKGLEGSRPDRNATEGLARSLNEKKPLLYSLLPDKKFHSGDPKVGTIDQSYLEMINQVGIKSYMVAPILVRGKVIGGISVFSRNSNFLFDKNDLDILEQLANSCSMAVDNAILFSDSQQSVKLREEFISIASHELRTPLTSLRLRVDLLEKMIERKHFPREVIEKISPIISKISPDLNKFTKLIEMLLDISKLNSKSLQLNKTEMDVSEILNEVLENFKNEFNSKGTLLYVNIEQNLLGECDALRLQQVVVNLLTNALKFSNKKAVEFSARREGVSLILLVKDHGIGMSPQDKNRIFKPFERAVSDRNFGGLGLGLYITFQVVEAYGGQIEVDSELGVGSTFKVILPLFTAS